MGSLRKVVRTSGVGATAAIALFGLSAPAAAGEGGASFYLLGSGGPGAAELPPVTGLFLDNTVYVYDGDAQASRNLVIGGNVVAGVDATIIADFASILWVPSTDVLGGTLGVGGAFAFGRPKVKAEAVLTGPLGNVIDIERTDAATIIGDPIVTAELSWNVATNTHAALAATVNIPIGHYREDELANLSFHRWILDTSAALTWADEEWDFSGKIGFTFNGENEYTDYDSGTDLHLEASVERKFSKAFSAGLQAYHLQQITGDSGEGATLGSFKGRVTGIGPTAAYNFMVGKTPVTARIRYFEEFNVKNRLDGRAFFFSLSLPLKMNVPAGAAGQGE